LWSSVREENRKGRAIAENRHARAGSDSVIPTRSQRSRSGGRERRYVISAGESGASYTNAGLARHVRVIIRERSRKEAITMLWTIFVVLLVLWAVGVVSSYTLGGFIHLLLLIAIAVVLIRIIQGRRPI